MVEGERCPSCGSDLPFDAPQGLCPACLLGQGLDTEGPATGATMDESVPPVGAEMTPSLPPRPTGMPIDPTATNPVNPGGGLTGDERSPTPGTRIRYFGDYELIKELGRGGMGVVYLARQISLNRPVALKLLKEDILATDNERRRFQNEAEAVARLDHPHIVPILEVGEHDRRRYFTMKLIGGPSLDQKIADYARDPKAAARLVAAAAEAVHHAHQRGILHRDLKPANILLDDRGEPYVSDFGLAKRIEGDSELTASGAILGTPAYMAPEQASGRRDAVTTASDVYGLGAVLYALLAGRAPFRGDSVAETLQQVREHLPEPPSRFKPHTPGDLEAICLKCLEKEPRKRYSSALALAEDLGRWLDGRTIQARQSGPAKQVFQWAKRKPERAILLVVLAAWYFNVRLPWQWAWLYWLFLGFLIVVVYAHLRMLWPRVKSKSLDSPLDFALDAFRLSAALGATLVLCFYHGNLDDRGHLALSLFFCPFFADETVRWFRRRKQAGPLIMSLHAPAAAFGGSVLVLLGILYSGNLVNPSAQTGDALVRVCCSLLLLGVLASLLLRVCVGVQLRKMGCLTLTRFVPWEAIEGYEWKPLPPRRDLLEGALLGGSLVLELRPRESAASLRAAASPAKKSTIDQILMEHLPQSAHPTDADLLQTFDFTRWPERTPADRMSGPALLLGGSGLITVLGAVPFMLIGIMGLAHIQLDGQPDFMKQVAMFVVVLLLGFASLCSGLIVLRGAWSMRKLKNYRLCHLSAVLAMLPLGTGFVLGLPFGIWALLVLRRADVRAAFAVGASRTPS